jgi:hypothetical protein
MVQILPLDHNRPILVILSHPDFILFIQVFVSYFHFE